MMLLLLFHLQLPVSGDADGRRALRRLQDVGVHILAPAAELAANPLAGAVAVLSVREALATGGKVPAGAARLALTLDGSETDEQLAAIKSVDAVVALLDIQVSSLTSSYLKISQA
eukprot:GHRR01019140.1.p2 GENE.GHRR01019140.1~~GHRR01019140.1.p2  ORF type:complete len:115 (-),score=47.82 GHRR01019140.1:1075-1419(-)